METNVVSMIELHKKIQLFANISCYNVYDYFRLILLTGMILLKIKTKTAVGGKKVLNKVFISICQKMANIECYFHKREVYYKV